MSVDRVDPTFEAILVTKWRTPPVPKALGHVVFECPLCGALTERQADHADWHRGYRDALMATKGALESILKHFQ